jgi:uncharacterized protein YukE
VSQRYTVELETLQALVARLGKFSVRAEQIATAVDQYTAELHTTWQGDGANVHEEYHTMWIQRSSEIPAATANCKQLADSPTPPLV